MIFEKQEYQQECISNVIEILREFDFKRHDRANLCECLKKFHSGQRHLFGENLGRGLNIPIKNYNANALNIDILMETGTGKTFTYLNLIYEIHRIYKQNKFIIFLPRKAILESVKQNIELTKDYFAKEYGGVRLKSYFYNTNKSVQNIITHYINDVEEFSVLVLTSGAMNKSDTEKSQNILHRSNEILPKSVFESIADLKPISIIDEPHLLKGEAFSKNFAKLNSLYFRFGATFPNEKGFELSNVAFVLDSISAFRQYLVKQVAVHTLFEKDEKPKLKAVEKARKRAKFAYFLDNVEYEKWAKFGEDLGVALNFSEFDGVEIVNASAEEIYLSNGESMQKSKENYNLNESQISHLLKKSIDLHFDKEEMLFRQNIKALSLFFIPSIKDFRGENAFVKKKFEELYKEKRAEILDRKDLDEKYKAFLRKDFDESGNLRVCEGYFSGDKSGENAEAEGVEIILKDKEKLLSLNTPLRFIFSVWALQEGWDNPNIFTLTKLASSANDTSKRQQIGRGLRLCVNQHGRRITHSFYDEDDEKFYCVNRLDVLVHNNELNFIEGLQNEINKASFVVSGDFVEREFLINLGLNDREINRFFVELENLNLVEFDDEKDKYKIISPIYESIKESAKMREILGENFNAVLQGFSASANKHEQLKRANEPKNKVEIRHILATKFKDLWRTLNIKSQIKYENIDEISLLNAIKSEFEKAKIPQEKSYFESKIYNAQNGKIETQTKESLGNRAFKQENIILNLREFSHKENLPLKFVLDIYNACKDKIIANPNAAFSTLKELIKEQIHQNIITSVRYKFGKTSISNDDPLFDTHGQPKAWIESYKLGHMRDEGIPKEPYLYKSVVYDSKIELNAIMRDEKEVIIKGQKIIIKVFAKLPKLKIPTPYKAYEPDFAYLIEKGEKQIFFICETKGYDKQSDISVQERHKIDYAKRFFEALNEHIKDENIEIYFEPRTNKQNLADILEEIL